MSYTAISKFFHSLEELSGLIFDCIRTENLSLLERTEILLSEITPQIKDYNLYNNINNDPAKKDLSNRFEKIVSNLARLISVLKDKINKSILFSEKAVREMEYLTGTIKHLSRCLKDVSLTKNEVLAKYIIDTANTLENTADNFALGHQERLLSGICQPQASAIFIDLLNTIKEVSYHFKETGRQISFLK
ncbi:MAG: hypothetical protein QME51_05545 [Planctomycetota bacterium]|nr:hypothetical protein [Planctomycetota bacterium]MDI6787816.1 hypothetical protein [Planctomycetota bacterium]